MGPQGPQGEPGTGGGGTVLSGVVGVTQIYATVGNSQQTAPGNATANTNMQYPVPATYVTAFPFVPGSNVTVSHIAIDVGTPAAGSNVHVGLYASAPGSNLPGALIQTLTSFNTAGAGVMENAITPVALTAGTTYWIAVGATGGQPTIRGFLDIQGFMNHFENHGATSVSRLLTRMASAVSGGFPASWIHADYESTLVPLIWIKRGA